jgi:excisionase family DNA binding protein
LKVLEVLMTVPLTVGDVARCLNVSEDTVRSFERSGRLPATKTSAGWRLFDPADVAKFAKIREVKRTERAKASNPEKVLA